MRYWTYFHKNRYQKITTEDESIDQSNNMSCQIDRIDPETFAEMKDAFSLFDKNNDGHISANELRSVLQALGQNPTQAMVEEVLKKADKNGDEVITFDEYIKLLEDNLKTPADVEIELRDAFSHFDKNKDNVLNLTELTHVLTCCGESLSKEEAQHFCNLMDTDGDGKVNIEEFVKFMCNRY